MYCSPIRSDTVPSDNPLKYHLHSKELTFSAWRTWAPPALLPYSACHVEHKESGAAQCGGEEENKSK